MGRTIKILYEYTVLLTQGKAQRAAGQAGGAEAARGDGRPGQNSCFGSTTQ